MQWIKILRYCNTSLSQNASICSQNISIFCLEFKINVSCLQGSLIHISHKFTQWIVTITCEVTLEQMAPLTLILTLTLRLAGCEVHSKVMPYMFRIKLKSSLSVFIWGVLQWFLKVFTIFFFFKNMIFINFIISKTWKYTTLPPIFSHLYTRC